MKVSQELCEQFRTALQELAKSVKGDRGEELLAIGLVTTDAVQAVGASLLFAGDLPADAPQYQRLSPVEWPHSNETAFAEVNQVLEASRPSGREPDEAYEGRVSGVFDACATAMRQLDLRGEFPRLAFLTFAGVDPNPVLERAERDFVRRLNPSEVFDAWCNEFG